MMHWTVPVTFMHWQHAPYRLNRDRVAFVFYIEGQGRATCFCTGIVLCPREINPKFKVPANSDTAGWIRNLMGSKFKSCYDASKGLKSLLEKNALVATVAVNSNNDYEIKKLFSIKLASRYGPSKIEEIHNELRRLNGYGAAEDESEEVGAVMDEVPSITDYRAAKSGVVSGLPRSRSRLESQ